MKDIINALFGTYVPVTYEVVDGETVRTVIPGGLAGVDWTYIAGVGLFAICLYSLLRMIGRLLK